MPTYNEQTHYAGIYHDADGELQIDIDSLDLQPYRAIEQFYADMTNLGIVDGSMSQSDSGDQLDDLNQSECDLIKLTPAAIKAIRHLK